MQDAKSANTIVFFVPVILPPTPVGLYDALDSETEGFGFALLEEDFLDEDDDFEDDDFEDDEEGFGTSFVILQWVSQITQNVGS